MHQGAKSPNGAEFHQDICGPREGITAPWAFRQLFVAYPGLRRLSRLRPGLSNFAPSGLPCRGVRPETGYDSRIQTATFSAAQVPPAGQDWLAPLGESAERGA